MYKLHDSYKNISLPKVHFFFAGLIPEPSSGQAMQTFCSISIQLQGLLRFALHRLASIPTKKKHMNY